jgi:alpha-mannosidase
MIPQKGILKLGKRIRRLDPLRYVQVADVALEAAETMEHFRKPPEGLPYTPAPLGSRWGEDWSTVWFRGAIEVPESCQGRRVFYRHRSDAERLLFVDGVPFGGMDPFHGEALLLTEAKGGEQFRIHVEAYTGNPCAHGDPFDYKIRTIHCVHAGTEQQPPLPLDASEIVVEREAVSALFFDADTLYKTALILDEHSRRRAVLLDELNAAFDLFPPHWDTEEELGCAARAVRERIAPLLEQHNAPSMPFIGVAGHAHIDVAWLWPVRESIRKSARTFSTMIGLMKEYPELTFVQSQPVLYQMVEDHYPELLGPIKQLVADGRWEPNGGMWVEADCNVPSGEALVRQFLEGHKKCQELFGYKADTLWLPDVFGYSAALPQILKGCGIEHFVTNKITWNEINQFPYSTFWWEGIDGSTVLAQFITTRKGNYNADADPEIMQDAWEHTQQKETLDSHLATVGWGDGGGGVTREMCEHLRRMEDLEGCPKTKFVNVSEFLTRLREQPIERPRWRGELYLEFHRGTYTTQARTKKYNRKLELLLREVELYATLAMPSGLEYPVKELEAHWRTVLLNQFHDILPGSSIPRVYEDAEREYAEVEAALLVLRQKALGALGGQVACQEEGETRLLANALSWEREDLVVLDAPDFNAAAVDANGAPLSCQVVPDGLVVRASLPPLGVTSITLRNSDQEKPSPFNYQDDRLSAPHYEVAFDAAGRITSLVDKVARRELVQEGRWLNAFYTADDMPEGNDAWDIDLDYRRTIRYEERLESREVVADGPLLFTLRSTYKIGRRSSLTQDMTFYAHSRRIDFATRVDWHEQHILLKAGFALDIHADTWRNEIQFGHVVRPTHMNTSWDQARFEVCAHKWVDLSEADYGVALLNDCKYGHDALDGMVSITLLKSPLGPDENADQGEHSFAYALYPHQGDFGVDTVVREAYAFNVPVTVAPLTNAVGEARLTSLCTVSNPNVIIEAVKRAENGNGIIVRLYEAARTRGPVTVRFTRSIREAEECSLLEERIGEAGFHGTELKLAIKPFQIRTFRVVLGV